jgi:ABC-type arginine transport system permease subunit
MKILGLPAMQDYAMVTFCNRLVIFQKGTALPSIKGEEKVLKKKTRKLSCTE